MEDGGKGDYLYSGDDIGICTGGDHVEVWWWRDVHVMCALIHCISAMTMVVIVVVSGPWRHVNFSEQVRGGERGLNQTPLFKPS